MAERGICRCCGNEYTVNANGTMRYHIATDPECQDANDENSRKCRGAGQLPKEERCENCGHAGHGHADMLASGNLLALKDCSDSLDGEGEEPCSCAQELRESNAVSAEGDLTSVSGYVCRECRHPVVLTLNGRSRSHLNPRTNPPERCGGGSDWPLWHNGRGDYRDEAPKGEVLPAARPEDLQFGSEDLVEDFLGTGGPVGDSCAEAAGDGRTAAQQAEPVGTALERLMNDEPVRDGASAFLADYPLIPSADPATAIKALPPEERGEAVDRLFAGDDSAGGGAFLELLEQAVGDPGTVLDRLGPDGQDPEGPGEEPTSDPRDALAAVPVWHRPDTRTTAYSDGSVSAGDFTDEALFDETHKVTDESGTEWIHPGPYNTCTMPECCTHPQGFEYGDDGKGHSGSFCLQCGAEEPAPPAPAWGTPEDILVRMPKAVQALAVQGPVCWDCGHPVIPLAERFEPSGSVKHVVWACEPNCAHNARGHIGAECRPRTPAQHHLHEVQVGSVFVRHTKPEPLRSLVYRVQAVQADSLTATVVSAGPYVGREGTLTNLTEEITCTDLEGRPRPEKSPTSSPERPTAANRPASAPSSTPAIPASAPSAGTTSTKETSSGPTAAEATSTRSAPMTDTKAAADFLGAASGSHGEAEAKYGRWGRYKLRHPATGKTVEWTRATTFAKSISDTFTLAQWGKRNVLLGATLRKDIIALAHGKDISKDREQLNSWCEELEQAAGSKVAANLGTAVHSFTEMIDRNWSERWRLLREEIPEDFRPHVEAYILLLEEHGLEPVPHMIEFSTGVLQYEVMGTSDNCYRVTRHLVLKMPRGEVRLSPGEHVIGDKKTGKDLDYGWQEICIQLALYVQGVNTQGIYNWADDTWDPDPLSRFAEPGTKVREDVGVILHLPVDPRSTKQPALHGVDLESGWNAAVLCERVRTWRKLRNLAGPVAVVDTDPLAEEHPGAALPPMNGPSPAGDVMRAAVRPPTLRERAEAVTSRSGASKVYQDAVAAKLPVAEVKELIDIMQKAIAKVAEPGGAKI